ncbi:MAG: amidohydrolase family protein [Candidatus Binatia bacterium]
MRLKIAVWLLCSLVYLLPSSSSAQTGKGMVIFADAVYHNGKVLTVDERFSIAQALAVRDGKVMAVGTNTEILNLAGPKTQRLDLKGKTIIPGFIDTHSHLFDYAPANWANDLEVLEPELKQFRQTPLQVKSVEDAVAQLKSMIAHSPAGKMLHVQLLPTSVAEEFGKKMMLKEMDELAPNHPIVVQLRGTDRRANSHIFKMFSDYFGALPEEIQTDNQGKPRGPIDSGSMRTLIGEILVKRPHTLAAIYKKELQAWGAKQAVDKTTALKMFTRWAAEYVLRDNQLGSLEPGKWADFVIIDRDYLNTADEDLSKTNVLMTAVAGKPVYTAPQFAKSEGLTAVGLRIGAAR